MQDTGLGCLPSCRELYLDVFWTQAPSAWPLPEAQSPGPVSWHVSLPPPAKEECRCPWGKWKHLVLARPVHISAGPHELAGDACTEEESETAAVAYFFSSSIGHAGHNPETQLNMFLAQKTARRNRQRLTSIQVQFRLFLSYFILRDLFHSLWEPTAHLG